MKLLYLPLSRKDAELIGLTKKLIMSVDDIRVFDFARMADMGINHHIINMELLELTKRFRPDWIHMQLAGKGVITEATLREFREIVPSAKITHWFGDWRKDVPDSLKMVCRFTDCTFISNNDGDQHKMYLEAGAKKVRYWQVAAEIHKVNPDPEKWTTEFCFIGNVYGKAFDHGPLRIEMAERLSKEYSDFIVYGKGWNNYNVNSGGICEYNEQIDCMATSSGTLSCDAEDGYHYYSGRFPRALMSGKPVVCHKWPGFEDILGDGYHALSWQNADEAMKCFEWLRNNPRKGKKIGIRGRKIAEKFFSWDYWVPKLIKMVDEL